MLEKRPDYLPFGKPDFTDEEIAAVTRVMKSGWIGMGPETIAFETELSEYIGAPEVVTVNSCTSALFLALLVEGVGPGDEVIVPSLTWCATANAALYLGATPVLCDVDPDTMSVTPNTILPLVTSRTKAVIVVHYGGLALNMAELRAALPDRIALVEDAAHAMGARYPDGTMVGASGNPVCFSFYANKNLSTADGGAVALFDPEKAERLRSLRMSGLASHAWSRFLKPSSAFSFGIAELGYKMNFTDLQASIGRVQLRRLAHMAEVRKQLADRYASKLAKLHNFIRFQSEALTLRHARHLLVAFFELHDIGIDRDELVLALRAQNIGASVHYGPLHLQPLYCRADAAPLPNTDLLHRGIVTLPISAAMTMEDVDYVCAHLETILMQKRKTR
ncbi:DegT/DnrJ/EryC1/StrS family aminotransferase [Roseibium sediminis]|uniref:DegT/DnrJ/EryC1/StrS family aminotransferase n=1 Tax=Roseibium sediminis TaxID=1775174 RepID=UPI001375D441|nr:DegT/DnrJ/EryC1/StrS aminotransferase family protein [Roseibium sediminis]